ncbi:hypothetical protein FAGAP_4380 [Fusarium agapanthi]|uniref:Uncharacterized protein n=1 Tax=Fusarium agapanthi TaxID=1803897 RepID=A0A9P5BBJ0_9HYPO|nr:hypothetical protein FAGAP_4380 [Fusarium agapanthi]
MGDHDLTQTHSKAVQGIAQQVKHLEPSPHTEQTVRKRNLGKHWGGSGLLRKAADLAVFDDVSLDLCFWDPTCSSWVGVKPQHSRPTSHNIGEFKNGRAMLRKRLRSLHNAIDEYVKLYDGPCRLGILDPFKEQQELIIRAPDGRHMDFQDWERACENRLPPALRSREWTRRRRRIRTRTRRVSRALGEGENTDNVDE